jgi:hypothetical protein
MCYEFGQGKRERGNRIIVMCLRMIVLWPMDLQKFDKTTIEIFGLSFSLVVYLVVASSIHMEKWMSMIIFNESVVCISNFGITVSIKQLDFKNHKFLNRISVSPRGSTETQIIPTGIQDRIINPLYTYIYLSHYLERT